MRHIKTGLLIAGVVLIAFLVYRIGAGAIVGVLGQLAWWKFALICVPYAFITAADTLAWRYAFTHASVPYWRLYGARLAGEALNLVTALGSVGGEAVKAWLIRRDVTYEESVPSVVIAKTTIVMGQAIFLLIGIFLASVALPVEANVIGGMLWLLGIEIVAVGGFVGAQVTGLVARMGKLMARFGLIAAPEYAAQLDESLREYYRRDWRRLLLSVGFHTLGWLLGAVEAFLVLWALDIRAGILTATVIEALGSGVRFASFMVPASLGAFEGANAAAFGALGLGAAAGIAFSLVRRARQVAWIVIGLVVMGAMRWNETASATRPESPARLRRRSAGGAPPSNRPG
ncbi:MAG: flippase-like domain-containing protein [Candidatus Rokubacteria bacterium]|nr:flippase-like domain-containing protein [Candidatus Rokubacteria bacterium]